jgi:threonine synthase
MGVEPDQYARWIAPSFRAARCDDEGTLATMRDVFRETGMLIDPHTAVGVSATRQRKAPGVPVVTLATAHPAKFPDAVERATGVRPALPDHLADLFSRPERTHPMPNDLAAIQAFVRSVARR